ncbi:hypothetical protein BLS_009401 [Venturia inaequalis]|uniref:Uncharacterized protein n=1 Tax=Venturia inaequalis TaxID=5025 RepID=A0A8H3V340_VENIN|nr:hypothetical protein BLS_009401 [Venturia inaequalis]
MADLQPEPDPRYDLLEAATRKASKQVAKVNSIAKSAIDEVETLQKQYDEVKAKAIKLEEEARRHAEIKKDTLSERNAELGEKNTAIVHLQTRLRSRKEENERLKEIIENPAPKPLIPVTRKPAVVVDLEGVDTDEESDLGNRSEFDTAKRDTPAMVPQSSKTFKELKRRPDAHFVDDEQVNKRHKSLTSLQNRRTINLGTTLTQETIERALSKFIKAYITGSTLNRHESYLRALELFEPLDIHTIDPLHRVRAIARLHSEELTRNQQEGDTLAETLSWKQRPKYRARATALQAIYFCYHTLQIKTGSETLRIMANHFGTGILVLLSPRYYLE